MAVRLFRGLDRPSRSSPRRGARSVANAYASAFHPEALEARCLLSVGIAVDGDPDPDPGPGPDPGAGPTIASLTASPNPLNVGAPLTLTANGVTSRAVAVSFYAESNGLPGLQGPDDPGSPQDRLVGTDNTLSGGYVAMVSTTGLAPGTYLYYAQAEGTVGVIPDIERVTSNIVEATSTIVQPPAPPTLGGLQANSTSVIPPATIRLTPQGLADPNGYDDIAAVYYYYTVPGRGETVWETGTRESNFAVDLDPFGMAVGPVTVSAAAIDREGNVSNRASTTFTVVNVPPEEPFAEVIGANFYYTLVTIEAAVWDANGYNDRHLELYLESNGIAGLQTGAGGDEVAVISGHYSGVEMHTFDEPPGSYTFYVFGADESGARSPVKTLPVTVLPNRPPTLASLSLGTTANPNGGSSMSVDPGEGVTLTAVGAEDPDQLPTRVTIFMERNGIPGLQDTDDVMAAIDEGAPPTITFSSQAAGTYTFYAAAVDHEGVRSEPKLAEVTVRNYSPRIDSFLASPSQVAQGGAVNLTAFSVTDRNGADDIRGVSFYRESNGVPGLQIGSDTGLGLDTTAADRYSLSVPASSLPGGPNTFYAAAIDAAGVIGAAAFASAQVLAPPTIRGLLDSPDPVRPGATLTLTAVGVSDPNGDAVTVWFYRESNGVAGLQIDDALLGPAGAAGGYALAVTAPTVVGADTLRSTYYAVGDDGTSRGNVVSAENLVSNGVTPATVVGRWLGYNNSAFDTSPGAEVSNAALATDKQALLPGQAPAFANVSSSTRGINAVVVDVLDLPAGPAPSVADFDFAVAGPGGWVAAPSPTGITLGSAGASGAGRVAFTWADGAIKNTWLRVTVKATAATGLAAPEVFVFGNLAGETGDTAGQYRVNALDLGAVKKALNGTAAITSRVDFNRDGKINALDLGAAKLNLNRTLAAPPALTLAASAATPALAPSPGPVAGLFSTTTVRDEATTDVLGLTT